MSVAPCHPQHKKNDGAWVEGYLKDAPLIFPKTLEWIRAQPQAIKELMLRFPPFSVVKLRCGCSGIVKSWLWVERDACATVPILGLVPSPEADASQRFPCPACEVAQVIPCGGMTTAYVKAVLEAHVFAGVMHDLLLACAGPERHEKMNPEVTP